MSRYMSFMRFLADTAIGAEYRVPFKPFSGETHSTCSRRKFISAVFEETPFERK